MKRYGEIVFVFGSNLAGRHGKGAALHAKRHWGAVQGVGEGRTGNAYALPTKDAGLRVLSPDLIESHIADFLAHAAECHDQLFLLTPVGCGLAGYSRSQIMAILRRIGLPSNVVLTASWFCPEATGT